MGQPRKQRPTVRVAWLVAGLAGLGGLQVACTPPSVTEDVAGSVTEPRATPSPSGTEGPLDSEAASTSTSFGQLASSTTRPTSIPTSQGAPTTSGASTAQTPSSTAVATSLAKSSVPVTQATTASTAAPTQPPSGGGSTGQGGVDPRFDSCKAAKAAGYGPYYRGTDEEYSWYRDSDGDGVVCE